MLLPLAFLALGFWEQQRGADGTAELAQQRMQAAKTVAVLESRPDMSARYRRNGQNYAGPLAVTQARAALAEVEQAQRLHGYRLFLPPVVMACAALVAGLSVLALLASVLLGRLGRASRDALVRGFSVVRRLLPPLMGAQVVLATVGVVAVIAFEASAIIEAGDVSGAGVKVLGFAAVGIGAALWTAAKAVMQLRRALDLFTPDPLIINGRQLSRAEAPGLWRKLDALAGKLGALLPDNVVVGLTGGFFVSSGPKILRPGGTALAGRTLYLPLPYLPLLAEDEVAAIIGHELAHFSGGDTEYSLRFMPIYAGVGRSLDAVAEAGTAGDGSLSPLLRPAMRLGMFVMDQFHHAVRHWSRRREFAADAAGASVTSAGAAARALLRHAAATPRIEGALNAAFAAPGDAPADLVAAILWESQAGGLADPAPHLEDIQPHPTDTHPPTRQRLVALGREPGPALLAEAAAAPPPEATERLAAYFADPEGLNRAATAEFLGMAHDSARQLHEALTEAAAGVEEAPVLLHENTRGGAIFLFCFGGLLIAASLAVVALKPPGMETVNGWIIAAAGGGLGLFFVVCGIPYLRRGRRPFLELRPDTLLIDGLDRPIAWAHVADLDMTAHQGRVVTRILLPPEAPFPERRKGGRRVRLDAKRRIITFAAAPPRRMKVQGYAEIIARYRQADAARRSLAQ
ncbi:peptidase M48 [Rhodovarius crocodyli]|uniref:Peptidase M48 n=1 Tax=Rhodovarius crocodyli TaxID=1979269 RepID=A0A437MPY4_9PROT|nr:peptidase M48 [Rhodovarius crocodyli]